MFKNFLMSAYRNFLKKKTFSLLNILGLSIGMGGFMIILQYVVFETSYESFLPAANQIYRVQLNQYKDNQVIFESAENYPGAGPALRAEIPEVMAYARLYNLGAKNNVVIGYNNPPAPQVEYKHRRFLYADSSFLPMFGYQLVDGDVKTALAEPFSMVISAEYARKYFGEDNPIGKLLHMRDDDFNDELCKVTGVVADLPSNTHLKFDVLISYKTLYARGDWAPERYGSTWQRKDMYTYIKVKPESDLEQLKAKIPALIGKFNPDLKKSGRRDEFRLQPLTDIHLYSQLTDEAEANGSGNTVYFLMVIGFFILVIAWINYVNLATARSIERANEVGVRKVLGADRRQLMRQFLFESFLMNAISLAVAFGITLSLLPSFEELAGVDLHFTLAGMPLFWVGLLGLYFAGASLSGFYPALVLSSFQPVSVLKGKARTTGSGVLLRKGLVLFQFAASVVLIAGTIIVYEQLDFMRSRDLGLNIDQTLVVERPGFVPDPKARPGLVEVFKNELNTHPGVIKAAGSHILPGKKLRFKPLLRQQAQPPESAVPMAFASIDYEFAETFGMKVIAGRNFDRKFTNDPDTSIILTRSAAILLGYKEPADAIGKNIAIDRFKWNRF